MSDDLVKRLLYWPAITKQNDIMKEAADRIEALEAQLAEVKMQSLSHLGQAQEAYEAQLKAEAQLQKAQEAIQFWVDATEIDIDRAIIQLCTFLADLKKDD